MARIRTIKPEFWSSPSVAGADPWVRLLFIAMWNWADDTGRGTANVKELAAFAFPHDDDPGAPTAAELPSLLTEIRGRFDVLFYEVGGRRFYAIPTWDKHQRNERRARSKYPAPEDGSEYDPTPPDQGKRDNSSQVTEVPLHSHGSSDASNGTSGPGTGEQGNRGTGEQKDSSSEIAPRPSDPPRPDVDQLCNQLRDRIHANGAKAAITKKWLTEARLLLDRDGRDLTQALRLIDWATSHSFWASNILSMPKFREKYDQLLMQARREHQGAAPEVHPTDAAIARLVGQPLSPPTLRALPGGETA